MSAGDESVLGAGADAATGDHVILGAPAAAVMRDELLSLEALLVARAYLYMLFHKAFGGEPDARLIELLASERTAAVIDEYAGESETLAHLEAFLAGLSRKGADEEFLAAVRDEFSRFFEGPAELPALPWESTHVGNETTVFQPSTLCVRAAYRSRGLQSACLQRMPDDHVSLMCAFMAELSCRALAAFRAGDGDRFREVLEAQAAFARDHMANWLPEYAEHALRVKKAFLYPQLAQGVSAFVSLDVGFAAEALAWVEEPGAIDALQDRGYDSTAFFGSVETEFAELCALRLRGLEDNELVSVARN